MLQTRLSPDQGALVRKALEQAREARDVSAETSGDERTHGQRDADSHLVMVRVDAEVVAAGAEGRCELHGGPTVAAEVARA